MLNYYSIIKELRIFAESTGYTVQFVDEKVSPRAGSNGVIKVHRPKPQWTEAEMLEWRAQVYHEIGHCVPAMRDCFDIPRKYDIDMSKEEILPALLNILDDYRQEKHDLGKFAGRDRTLSKGHAQIMESLNNKMSAINMDEESDFIKRVDAILAADTKWRSEWQKDLIGVDEKYAEHLTDEQKEWYDKLLSYKDDVNNLRTAEEEYELTKRIIEEVFDLDAEEERQKASGDDSEGDGGEGSESGDDKAGDGMEEGKGKKAKGKGEAGDKGKGKEKAAGKVKYKDLLKHKHDEHDKGASYHPLEVDYDDYDRSYDFVPKEPNVHDFTTGQGVNTQSTEYIDRVDDIGASRGLANRIRKLLQVRSQAITVHGQKRGRLANKSLHRVTMTDTGEYQRKVFKKKVDSNILDTSVTILSDYSGSMGGEKMEHNIASALLLNDTLAKIRVPVEIIGFSHVYTSDLYLFKTHKKQVNRDKLRTDMGRAAAYDMHNNADGEAILWAYDRLRRQETKRKLLIVLSDGQPAARGGDIMTFTQDVVKKIEQTKDVEIYGIGIMSDSVQHIYKHNRVINSSNELEGAVLTVIRDYILNK